MLPPRRKRFLLCADGRVDPAWVSRILARLGNGNPSAEGDKLLLKFPAGKVRKKSNKETSCISYAPQCVQNSVHIARILGATLGAAREGKMAPDFL